MNALQKIELLTEHAELVQRIATLTGLSKIDSLERLSEIVVLLGGKVQDEVQNDMANHRGKTDIDTLLEVATSRGGGNQSFTNLAKVTDETAKKIKDILGIDVTGFDIGIDESAIRHTLNQHGNEQTEQKRGQTAVTQQDFALVAEITNNADVIKKGNSENTLQFEKQIGSLYVVVQELRIGKGKLSLKTMYKKGLTSVLVAPDENQSTAETPETVGSLALENNIPQNDTDVNPHNGKLSKAFYDEVLLMNTHNEFVCDDDETIVIDDWDITNHEKTLIDGKSYAFARAMIAIDKIAGKNGWNVAFGDFGHTLTNNGLFDSVDSNTFDVIAQVENQGVICRVVVNEQGYCNILHKATGANKVFHNDVHYKNAVLIKGFYHIFNIDKDIEMSDLSDEQKALLNKYQTAVNELQKYDVIELSSQVNKVQEWERMFNGATNGNTDDLQFLVKNAKDHSRMSATRKALDIFTNGELKLNSTVNQTKSEQLIREYFADTNVKLVEIEKEQERAKIAKQEAERQAKQDKDQALYGDIYQAFGAKSDVEIARAKSQLFKSVNTAEFGVQNYKALIENLIDNHGYKPHISQMMKRKGENAGDRKEVYRIADEQGSGYTINKTQYVYASWYYEQKQLAQNSAQKTNPNETQESQPVQENEPMNKPENPNYTQDDLDYLNSIVNGTTDLATVDMDKMIEIGEKDDTDPLYTQALQIISDYLDEVTSQ